MQRFWRTLIAHYESLKRAWLSHLLRLHKALQHGQDVAW